MMAFFEDLIIRKIFTQNAFFSVLVFFCERSRIKGLQRKGEGISLTPHYHVRPLHRHLNISQAITAESSPLHIASNRTRTETFGFGVQVANQVCVLLGMIKFY